MRVALAESETHWEDPRANRERIEGLEFDADLVVFPEMAFTGFTMRGRPDPEAAGFLADYAREHRQAVIAGYVGSAGDGELPQNVAAAFDADGSPLARYAKLHPFTFAGEDRHYAPGSCLPVFGLGGLRCAMAVCYDLRFPEMFREATLRGAQAIFVIANWPARREDHWRTLLKARAIENQAYVVGVNRIGSDPNVDYVSSSMAFDPRGELLGEGACTVEIDAEIVTRWREEFPALRDVRTDRYGLTPDA